LCGGVVKERIAVSFVFLVLFLKGAASAQECGKANVSLAKPEYYVTTIGTFAVEPPSGWFHDDTRKNPFYFVKRGENYNSAKTLMYVSVEPLEGTFDEAVQNDAKSYRQRCDRLVLQTLNSADLLERGCRAVTQVFTCVRKKGSYIDLDTKFAINGILLNVVLSTDDRAEIEKYKADYSYLLLHLAKVN
jgi:hypothetical protein